MANFTNELNDLSERILWSLWTELGVPGVERNHADCAIDVEATLVATPFLALGDPRLLGLALDWCIAHHKLIAGSRIKTLLKGRSAAEQNAYSAFASRVNQAVPRALPVASAKRPLEFSHGPKTIALDLSRSSLLPLRFAAIFGVGIRASVLSDLFVSGSKRTVTELAALTAYQRRAIAIALETLVAAGVVEQEAGAGRVHYRLTNEDTFAAFAGAKPGRNIHWPTVLSALADIVTLARAHAEQSGPGAVVAMSVVLDQHKAEFQRLRLKPPVWIGKPSIDAGNFRHWAVHFATNMASGRLA